MVITLGKKEVYRTSAPTASTGRNSMRGRSAQSSVRAAPSGGCGRGGDPDLQQALLVLEEPFVMLVLIERRG
jgi:hypothetical protein